MQCKCPEDAPNDAKGARDLKRRAQDYTQTLLRRIIIPPATVINNLNKIVGLCYDDYKKHEFYHYSCGELHNM